MRSTQAFNWFDVVLILIMLWSALAGLRAGFARVIVHLIATIVGLVAGFWFYRMLAAELIPWVKNITAANIMAFLIIFVGVLIIGSLVSALLSRLFRWVGLSWFNHVLGGAAGVIRGALVIAVLVDVMIAFSPSPTPAFLDNSRVLPYTLQISSWIVDLAPRELKDAFTEQMKNLKQFWAPQQDGHSREV
ncbi:MAG: CvpA family protein [Acidobacteriaceae bacterium]|nr:CvpA family protein [Acidobacteriaceae bacterium]MBV9781338.1 CvpA family protein [Acidobacteriaceae bacterium]